MCNAGSLRLATAVVARIPHKTADLNEFWTPVTPQETDLKGLGTLAMGFILVGGGGAFVTFMDLGF